MSTQQSLDLSSTRRKLQGRDTELGILTKALEECKTEGSAQQIIAVHGASGSGKSALCSNVNAQWFASGKFDQYSSGEPYLGISEALSQLGSELLERGEKELLRRCLKDEATILAKAVPTLATALDHVSEGESSESMSFASERVALALGSFFKEFCTPDRPLVFFLDDVQWSDKESLSILSKLANNPEMHNLVLLLGYRDGYQEIQTWLESLPHVTDVPIGDLDLSAVNLLIADLLKADTDRTLPLAETALRKTLGNPFFLLRFLEMLQRKQLLYWEYREWNWDLERIESQEVSDNVAQMLTRQVESLPERVRRILILASCLGFLFDVDILKSLDEQDVLGKSATESDLEFEDALERAVKEGLVEPMSALYKFSHDRIRQCAYEMLPQGERDALHYHVGQHVRDYFLTKSDSFLFLAVNQLNRGVSSMSTDEEAMRLIELNLQASKAAKQKSAIELAHEYLKLALGLSKDSYWAWAYNTMLELNTFSAEIECSLGRIKESENCVQSVLDHSKSLKDTIRVRYVNMKLLATSQLPQALAEARKLLKELGHGVPPSRLPFFIYEVRKTKRMLKKKSLQEMINMAPIEDYRALWSLRILQQCFFYGWSLDLIFSMLSIAKSVQICLRHGCSEVTPSVFASWGYIMSCSGDFSQGHRCGEFAISQVKSKNEMASTYAMVCFATVSKKPSVVNMDLLLQGYRAGLESGDVYRGAICVAIYSELYVALSGLPLKPFAEDMLRFGRQILICRQYEMMYYISSSLQVSLVLTGRTDDAIVSLDRTGEMFDAKIEIDPTPNTKLAAMYKELFVCYVLALPFQEKFDEIYRLDSQRYQGVHFFNFFMAVMDGLAAVSLFKSKKNPRYARIAKNATREMRKHVKAGSVDSVALLALLEAEIKSLYSKTLDQTKPLYDDAISQFVKTGMNHFGAIANERAAEQLQLFDDEEYANDYLRRAAELYSTFGATRKVADMEKRYPSVGEMNHSTFVGGVSNRGRQRFESVKDTYSVVRSAAMVADTSGLP